MVKIMHFKVVLLKYQKHLSNSLNDQYYSKFKRVKTTVKNFESVFRRNPFIICIEKKLTNINK